MWISTSRSLRPAYLEVLQSTTRPSNLPYSDPLVQDAILTAQSALLGLASPLAFIGPNLVSSSVSFVGSLAETVIDSQLDSLFTGVTNTIGPTSILAGDLGVCAGINITGPGAGFPLGCTPGPGTPFNIVSGSNNFNSNTHTLTEIFQTTTTTDTFLTSELYDLTGDPAVEPIPEPGAVLLAAAGLAGLVLLKMRR